MAVLDIKYSIANADCSAFVYVKVGRPAESFLPMISGISDTQQGCVDIINRMRAYVSRELVKKRIDLANLDSHNANNTWYAQNRDSMRKSRKDWIMKLESMETAVYHIVKISTLVVA